ncbi:DoxX family membrane protein [Maribellus comscasis]|uniref:DoxX family membrane protein n=1 Tax=Maribellus comscasis TaxID=2681766 RepID=A0A6I6K193_9BACT|nr:DoxX family protein [Maribellus comscasis]QGY46192.1 DoxX family membrane protein [Maribellus comscasis]
MKKYSVYLLTGLRILVGWHFLYEGIAKLMTPGWSAKLYLLGSRWVFSDVFHQMAESDGIMKIVDFMNIWGLILVGISLFLGLLTRWSSIAGALLLFFYFVAYPPIPGYTFGTVMEGSYVWVNKTLIEFFILLVFVFIPVGFLFGVDRLLTNWKEENASAPVPLEKDETSSLQRREVLRNLISVPFLGAFAYAAYKKQRWDSYEEKFLNAGETDAVSAATLKSFNFSSLADLKGEIPKGKIGDLDFSRLIMGGNLIGGWAHSRDLIYVSRLVKEYHNDERVIMTLQLAEKCGVDSIITNPSLGRIMNKYWHETGGKIKFISDCGDRDGFLEGIKRSQEVGASAMYCQGAIADRLAQNNDFETIRKGLELIRNYDKPAGIGAHKIETIEGCVERGIKPDFWVKTLHHHNYWSAHPDAEQHDNMFCFKPSQTIEFMNQLEEPWIAFKVLAAGAISPQEGFKFAFDNGADFICVGMYDFQIVEDCNMVVDSLANINRIRPWRG